MTVSAGKYRAWNVWGIGVEQPLILGIVYAETLADAESLAQNSWPDQWHAVTVRT